MSWESSLEYYRIINEEIQKRLGGIHSGKIIMYSLNFAELEELMNLDKWDEIGKIMAKAAISLEKAGADIILIASNTAHKVAHYVTTVIQIPFLHIADATGFKIQQDRLHKVGILGTKYTMEDRFITGKFIKQFGIEILIPDSQEREAIQNIIFNELCKGITLQESKEIFIKIINNLQYSGIEGIILGCTEIELLIKDNDCSLPLYPTAKIHALAAVDFSLS